jgi:hypothetical protein
MPKLTIFGLSGTPIEITVETNDLITKIRESLLESLSDPSKRPFTDIRYEDESGNPQRIYIPADAIRRCVFQISFLQ